jgi:hypothetical protein
LGCGGGGRKFEVERGWNLRRWREGSCTDMAAVPRRLSFLFFFFLGCFSRISAYAFTTYWA